MWTTASGATTPWLSQSGDYFSLWGQWSTTTWGTIQSRQLTWDNMSGHLFTTGSSVSTIWTTAT